MAIQRQTDPGGQGIFGEDNTSSLFPSVAMKLIYIRIYVYTQTHTYIYANTCHKP